jgi:hypothetical protein
VLNKIVKSVNVSGTREGQVAATTDRNGFLGICSSFCGASGTAVVQKLGFANCVFSTATTAGDYAVASSTAGGECADYGTAYPTDGTQVLGRTTSTNGSPGTYTIDMIAPESQSYAVPTDFGTVPVGRALSSMFKSYSLNAAQGWTFWQAFEVAVVPSGSSAPTVDAVSPTNTGASSSLTQAGVAAPVNGEGLYAFICASNGGLALTWNALPTGWSNIVFGTNDICGLFYKTATGSEPSTYTFSLATGGASMSGVIWEVQSGNPPSSPPTSAAQGTSGAPTAASITTASANNLVFACFGSATNQDGFSHPAGFSYIIDPSVT